MVIKNNFIKIMATTIKKYRRTFSLIMTWSRLIYSSTTFHIALCTCKYHHVKVWKMHEIWILYIYSNHISCGHKRTLLFFTCLNKTQSGCKTGVNKKEEKGKKKPKFYFAHFLTNSINLIWVDIKRQATQE